MGLLEQRYSIFLLRSELLRASIIFLKLCITNAMDMNLGKLPEVVRVRKARRASIHGVSKSQTWLGNWTTKTIHFFSSGIKSSHGNRFHFIIFSTDMTCYYFYVQANYTFKCSLKIVLLLIMWIILVFMEVTDTYL